ncbi:hypothetical protein SCHPADRAFT_925793 [Schizopora paradoxa]|uniref:F-box domain-containing protein n=1 Tax=Schizopora paradoxa TaxID=27342 RepID=A0A0H2S0T4_9AGAM|nr:hypothetical protein SCHPADRAFT_925793 [Schizopora paradoxa]
MAQFLHDYLLYDIFLYALPSKFLFTMEEGSSSEPWMIPPLTFSLVCRSWRALVLSRPRLWSDMLVDLRFEPDENYHGPSIPQILKKWLNLSYPATLWIYLSLKGDGRGYITDSILPLFILEHQRLEFASIRVSNSPPRPTSFTIPCSAPLTHLSLWVHGTHPPAAYVDLSHYIGDDASRLEYLDVDSNVSVRLPQCREALRLPHLSSFDFESSNDGKKLEDMRAILCASQNLERIYLSLKGKSISTAIAVQDPMRLARLTSLSLRSTNRFTINFIFDLLTCPCLHELKLYIQRSFDETEITENSAILEPRRIQDFLAQSSPDETPPLEHLTLEWFGYDATSFPNHAWALKDLLVFLQNLKTLKLQENAVNSAVLEMLAIRTGEIDGSQPCPFLSEIGLTTVSRCGFTEEMVERMVVSRWKAGRLRKANLYFATPSLTSINMRGREQIIKCIQEGLVFNDVYGG